MIFCGKSARIVIFNLPVLARAVLFRAEMHPFDRKLSLALLASVAVFVPSFGQVTGGSGGGPLPQPLENCIPQKQQAEIEAAVLKNAPQANDPHPADAGPAPYPFQPVAGTAWQDRFINNFVDLKSGSGILDWDCTDFTYNGHGGHDLMLRSFGEQDIGVPVFAALDGTVVALHDGEFDRNTVLNSGAPANYVVLDHGNGHQTHYFHLRSNSVAVTLNQFVTAGTQLGLAGSSGYSSGPHLHFESRLNGPIYEPYAGLCQTSNPSRWVSQTPIRRDTYLGAFALHGTNNVSPFLPENPPRKGTFVRAATYQSIGAWYVLHNQPSNSTWRVRYKRPNATIYFDSGTQNHGNATTNRWAAWWFYFGITPDTSGNWTMEFSVNSNVMINAPFLVLNAGGLVTNRAPNPVTASFDPPTPTASDVIFCRLNFQLLEDPDYDLVRYRYVWKLNGNVVRDTTNAAFSDALWRGAAQTGDYLTCTVTPSDGATNGSTVSLATFVGGPVQPSLSGSTMEPTSFRLTWPAFGPPFQLQFTTNLFAPNWQTISNGISQSGGQNVVTNPGSGNPRWFRLRFAY